MKIELKPCPFCGGRAELYQYPDTDMWSDIFFVRCTNRNCGTCPKTKEYLNKEDAIAAWNTRKRT